MLHLFDFLFNLSRYNNYLNIVLYARSDESLDPHTPKTPKKSCLSARQFRRSNTDGC